MIEQELFSHLTKLQRFLDDLAHLRKQGGAGCKEDCNEQRNEQQRLERDLLGHVA